MDSGKEYLCEKDNSLQEFMQRCVVGLDRIKYITLDKEEKIIINPVHISSVEILEETIVEYDESDPIVYG